MKSIAFVLIFVIISSQLHICAKNRDNIRIDSILSVLNKTIAQKDVYVKEKEKRIVDLKKILSQRNLTLAQRYEINNKLYSEYKSFIPDSAISYQQRNIDISLKLNDLERFNNSKMELALSYAITGMYADAEELLNSIEVKKLPDWQLHKYYESYKQLAYFYPQSPTSKLNYQLYRDSLLLHSRLDTNAYNIILSEKLIDMGNYNEARRLLIPMFNRVKDDSNWMAVLAYAIGQSYRGENNFEEQKKYYAISAISDIKNAIRVNASMRMLAIATYETNDIEHAYLYGQQAINDAVLSNSNLRTMEVMQIFSIIEKTYQQQMREQQYYLSLMVVCISLLSLSLIITLTYVYIQFRNLAKVRKFLSTANVQLQELNQDLKKNYEETTTLNKELKETNLLKETYISQFLNICSMYINKLEKYQNTLNKKAMEHKLEELYSMLKSKEMIEVELKNLYDIFDNVFIHLYPNFVERFNELLRVEERIELKSTELLNPELRIFALIRLGITDNSQIADFLHYSSTTIYNYKTRVRNKAAVPREEFENLVMKIN